MGRPDRKNIVTSCPCYSNHRGRRPTDKASYHFPDCYYHPRDVMMCEDRQRGSLERTKTDCVSVRHVITIITHAAPCHLSLSLS
jgi:hypothetical protein